MKLRSSLQYQNADLKNPIWRVWRNMIQRTESTHTMHRYYQGVTVCAAWHDFAVFRDWALTAGWQHGLTLDRIDNAGSYGPDNCRICTRSENLRNTRRAVIVELHGQTKPLADWADRYGVDYATAWRQYKILRLTAESIFLRQVA